VSFADYVGLFAGGIVTLGLVPQIIRIYKFKSAHDISALFNVALLTGMTLFFVYGILLFLRPLIFWNGVGMILMFILLYGKWKYGR
jgi:MtN3 and saliva related transmembrane protein